MGRLVVIGLAAGVFSALFGVGGGIVVVPMLILAVGFSARPATATSLVAIGIVASAGALSYGVAGEVEPGPAALVGLPGAVGAVAGAALQQRLTTRTLSLAFAALLAALGVRLVVA